MARNAIPAGELKSMDVESLSSKEADLWVPSDWKAFETFPFPAKYSTIENFISLMLMPFVQLRSRMIPRST